MDADVIDLTDERQADRYVGWFTRPGRVILGERLPKPADTLESRVYRDHRTNGAVTVFATAPYDPGNQAYRLHSAINACTPHASLFARRGNQNPFANYRQIDLGDDREIAQAAQATADVVHCHIDPWSVGYLNVQWRGQLVVHYHGSDPPGKPKDLVKRQRDEMWDILAIGARLDHGEYGDIPWVPMVQPVERLHALRRLYRQPGVPGIDRPFRIGHSPTHQPFKGTATCEAVVESLIARGLNIEWVLIAGHRQADALAWKATCDLVFDSFWLGLQGSGLEAGAMGIPVIAGDARTRRLHEAHCGYCPYLFADDPVALEEQIVACVESPEYASRAAAVLHRFVRAWHSQEAVSARYFGVLAERVPALRDRILQATHTAPLTKHHVPPMRPDDDYPWLKDSAQRHPPLVVPIGVPHVPERVA